MVILDNKLKAGDILELEQEDGNVIMIHVYPNAIMIKANFPGTRLEVTRSSSFSIQTTAVSGKKNES